MLVRLPSGEEYVRQIAKEHKCLPLLAPKLPLPIPKPIAMGKPSNDYPWDWSIYVLRLFPFIFNILNCNRYSGEN